MAKSFGGAVLLLSALVVSGCTDDRASSHVSDDPAEHFEQIEALISEGDFATANVNTMPPSFLREIDALLRQMTALVPEEDFPRALSLLKTLGEQLPTIVWAYVKDDEAPAEPPWSDDLL